MARGRRHPAAAAAAPALHPGGVAVTEGAEPAPLVSLPQLAERYRADREGTLLVSDVHGDADGLAGLLSELGVIDSSGRRVPGARAGQLGDLVDGRRPGDYDALVLGERVFDFVVCGNHEAALLGGPRFDGLVMIAPEVRDGLWRMARSGKLVVAAHAGDVLISHAGVCAGHELPDDPSAVVAALEESFYDFCGRTSEQDPLLFAIDPARGGVPGRAGGVLWQDWGSLVDAERPGYRQIVGHSRVGSPEQVPGGQIVCLDPDGPALGAAFVGSDGEVLVAERAGEG